MSAINSTTQRSPDTDASTYDSDASTHDSDPSTHDSDPSTHEPGASTSQPDASTSQPDASTSQPDASTVPVPTQGLASDPQETSFRHTFGFRRHLVTVEERTPVPGSVYRRERFSITVKCKSSVEIFCREAESCPHPDAKLAKDYLEPFVDAVFRNAEGKINQLLDLTRHHESPFPLPEDPDVTTDYWRGALTRIGSALQALRPDYLEAYEPITTNRCAFEGEVKDAVETARSWERTLRSLDVHLESGVFHDYRNRLGWIFRDMPVERVADPSDTILE